VSFSFWRLFSTLEQSSSSLYSYISFVKHPDDNSVIFLNTEMI
jgi:hypothetical protein